MVSDDLTALAAISMGVLAPVALTLALRTREAPAPPPAESATHVLVRTSPDRALIDFAIIRGHVETMVGPESPATGWDPGKVELLLRTR